MTLRHISTATGSTTDAVVKAWKLLPFGNHPGLDATLPKEQAETLLSRLALPTTRRTPEAAQAAATLLAEFRAGMHQNGHMEPTKARTIAPMPKPTRRTTKQPERIMPEPAKQNNLLAPIIRAITTTTKLDVVYYFTLATACYGSWYGLGKSEMGIAFGVVYSLVSLHALGMAKDPASRKTAIAGIVAVCIFEIVAFFADLNMFNLRLWQSAKADILAFRSYEVEFPFTIACILAGLFSAAGIYSVAVTFSLTSEKHAAKENEKKEAERAANNMRVLREALEDSARQWMIASGQNYFDTEKAGVLAEKYTQILNQKND